MNVTTLPSEAVPSKNVQRESDEVIHVGDAVVTFEQGCVVPLPLLRTPAIGTQAARNRTKPKDREREREKEGGAPLRTAGVRVRTEGMARTLPSPPCPVERERERD